MTLREFLLQIQKCDQNQVVRIGCMKDCGWRYIYNVENLDFISFIIGGHLMDEEIYETYEGYDKDICIVLDRIGYKQPNARFFSKKEFEERYGLKHLPSNFEDWDMHQFFVHEMVPSRLANSTILKSVDVAYEEPS